MSVIDQFKKRPVPDPNTQPIAHNLSFFVPQSEDTKAELRRVDVEMVENSRNPNHVPDQLAKLFGACNLPTKFLTEIGQVDNFQRPRINGSIRDFLLDNRHYARQMSADAAKERTELEGALRKLRREIGVNLTMNVDPVDSTHSAADSYQALQEFADAYQEWRANLSDKERADKLVNSLQYNLNYSDINYTSTDPVIFLDRSSPETWRGYLARMDLKELSSQVQQDREEKQRKMAEFTKKKKDFDSHTRELERLLRVRSISWKFHDDPTDDPHHYLGNHDQMDLCQSFTSMLINNKAQIQKILNSHKNLKMKNLNIGISPNLRKSEYLIEMDGVLKISTRVSFDAFMQIILQNNEKAIEVQRLADKMEQMRDYVQVRLGLKELTTLNAFVYTHGYEKVYAAYQRLHEESEKLRSLQLNGLSIIIADYYSISRAGELFIHYDFTVEDFIAAISAPPAPEEDVNGSTEFSENANDSHFSGMWEDWQSQPNTLGGKWYASYNRHRYTDLAMDMTQEQAIKSQYRTLPQSLTRLHITDLKVPFCLGTDLPKSLYCLILNGLSNALQAGALPFHITHLILFNPSIPQVVDSVLPESITRLTIYGNHVFKDKPLPSSITRLLIQSFEQVPCGIASSNITHLTFDSVFNQPLLPGSLPSGLLTLEFGMSLPWRFKHEGKEIGTKEFRFSSFNQQILPGVLPATLTTLILGSSYNQPLLMDSMPS
eukprot:gene11201-13060_t